MINYIEKGVGLHDAFYQAGLQGVKTVNNATFAVDVSEEQALQAIINSYNPIPYSQKIAKAEIKEASAIKRLEYVTQAAGKDAEYVDKREEARLYDIDQTVGDFMQGRINRTNESPSAIAAEWNSKAVSWKAAGVLIAALEDSASRDIDEQTDWRQCDVIAKTAIRLIEAI